jgi:hypothetical protein
VWYRDPAPRKAVVMEVTHNREDTVKLFITNQNGYKLLHCESENKCLRLLLQLATETIARYAQLHEDFVMQI